MDTIAVLPPLRLWSKVGNDVGKEAGGGSEGHGLKEAEEERRG